MATDIIWTNGNYVIMDRTELNTGRTVLMAYPEGYSYDADGVDRYPVLGVAAEYSDDEYLDLKANLIAMVNFVESSNKSLTAREWNKLLTEAGLIRS